VTDLGSVTHFVKRCEHGTVVAQCRCPGPKTATIVPCPEDCTGDTGSITLPQKFLDDIQTIKQQRDEFMAQVLLSDQTQSNLMEQIRELTAENQRLRRRWNDYFKDKEQGW